MKIARSMMLALLMAAASTVAHAANCAQKGGDTICGPATITGPTTTGLCDDQPAAIFRMEAWCIVSGGEWIPDPQGPHCSITAPPLNASSNLATSFEQHIHGQQCVAGGGNSGCTNIYCNCTQTSEFGIVTHDYQILPFQGNGAPGCSPFGESVIVEVATPVGCPAGWQSSGDPDLPCMKTQFCWQCYLNSLGVGNPINVGNGDKTQRETDYVSPSLGGVRFERFYNSGGFFDPTNHAQLNTHYWRHTYSWKLFPYTGSAYLMAILQRADGTLTPFNTSGAETQNNDGAASRLAVNGTGWTLTTPDNDVYQFDSAGRLTTMTTRAGFVTTLAYDTSGNLQTVTDTFGRSLTLTYDGSGNLATMTDPAARQYQYGYDSSGRLSTATYPDSSVRTYLYENTAFLYALTGVVDERGIRISTYGYDAFGRGNFTQHTGPDNYYTLNFADSSSGESVNVIDGFGNSQSYQFTKVNGALKKTSQFDSVRGTEQAAYDSNGNPTSKTNRRGITTTYTYDSTRNLELSRTEASNSAQARTIATTWHPTYRLPATITEPSGVAGVNLVTTFTYDTAGNLIRKNLTAGSNVREWNYTVNARGQVLTIDGPRTDVTDVTTMTYYGDADACIGCRGQVHTAANALGQVTTFGSYDGDGRPTQITDANGVATTLTYKTRGWLASRTTAGETTSYDYDASGNLTRVTMPDGSFIAYQYDDAPALIGISDSLGNSIEYELDVMGNRIAEKVYDPNSLLQKAMQRAYDVGNRLQRDVGAASQVTSYAYDTNDNLVTVTDPLQRVTTNTYDALDRLTNVQDAANGNTVFGYDAKDRLTSVKDPRLSNTTNYTYDGLGNLLVQLSPDTGTTTFTYDAAGNVATQVDARSASTAYTYDALNRVTAASVTDGTVAYEYDNVSTGGAYARGHLTKITDPSGNTTYAYDSLGRITSKAQTTSASPANKTFTVGYSYANGRLTGITYPSGHAITYSFDGQGRIASITVDGSATVLSSATYFPFGAPSGWTWGNGEPMTRTFDQDGRVSTLTLGPASASYPDLSQVFGYDNLNRMVSANLAAGQSQGFTYDSNGNRTSATINAASTTYNYPGDSHKLSSLSGGTSQSFTYDNAGNLTLSAGVAYVYDGRGRMKQAGSTTYLVNGLGQRVKKSSVGDTFFAYDEAGHLIGEYDGSGSPIEETVWLGDTPVAVVKPKTGGFDVFYIWSDNLGTPRLISDTTNAIRWQWDNADPFGNNAPNENPSGAGAFSYNLRFPGQYFDAETAKHYNYFRDYDPGLGRYVESDPIGLSGGTNTYAYIGGDPLTGYDPTGQFDASGPLGRALGRAGITMLGGGGPENPVGDAAAIIVGVASLGYDIYQACKDKDCPPCKPYAAGTVGWTRLDTSHGHYPIKGPHLHLRQVNQRKTDCKCFWNDAKPDVAAPPPHPDWVDLSAGEPPLTP